MQRQKRIMSVRFDRFIARWLPRRYTVLSLFCLVFWYMLASGNALYLGFENTEIAFNFGFSKNAIAANVVIVIFLLDIAPLAISLIIWRWVNKVASASATHLPFNVSKTWYRRVI